MDRASVSSSHLVSVGYDPSAETLEVEFTNQTIYQYYDVPTSRHAQTANASAVNWRLLQRQYSQCVRLFPRIG